MMGNNPQQQTYDRSVYPPIREALEATVLGPINDYITWQQKTISQYTVMYMIYEICTGTDRMEG